MTRKDVADYFDSSQGNETLFCEALALVVEADLQDDEQSQLWCVEPDALRMMILATDTQVIAAFLASQYTQRAEG